MNPMRPIYDLLNVGGEYLREADADDLRAWRRTIPATAEGSFISPRAGEGLVYVVGDVECEECGGFVSPAGPCNWYECRGDIAYCDGTLGPAPCPCCYDGGGPQ